jgi:hypothetical protein
VSMLSSARGASAVDIVFSLALLVCLATFAVPLSTSAADEFTTSMAARYVATRIMEARMQAVSRSSHVGIRFVSSGDDYVFTSYIDGNYNGVRTADIANGADRAIAPGQRLADQFRGTRFGLTDGVPDADGALGSSEGVRVGSSRILATSPDGTATSGTLYIQGRRGQYAVRVLGATGRTRVLRYDRGAGKWTSH